MSKTVFTHASPKAAKGIRNLYAKTGADVRVFLNPGASDTTVVVTMPPDKKGGGNRLLRAKA